MDSEHKDAREAADFDARFADFMAAAQGNATPGPAAVAVMDQRAAAVWLAHAAVDGALSVLVALQQQVPGAVMHSEALAIVNACGTVLSLSRSELDTILKSEALAYAASGDTPDAA